MKSLAKLGRLSLVLFCSFLPVYAVELKGVVKSEKGVPLAGVQILSEAPLIEGARFLAKKWDINVLKR
jgi:hypothetical protein